MHNTVPNFEPTFPKEFSLHDRLNELRGKEYDIDFEEEIQEYTCYNCTNASTCEFAYDEYNLMGDCLLSK